MRRAMLAVLLSLCIPILLFGQHGGREGGSSSGSSSSSSSSGGYSGGSSGGYSGSSGSSGSSHSSSSSSSGSSSGGSSSGSSGGSSGSSHSSSSGGSSGSSSHSNSGEPSSSRGGSGSSGSHPGAGVSVGTHATNGSGTPRSNMRTGDSDSSGQNSRAGSDSRSNLRGAGSESGPGSQLYSGNAWNPWDQPVQFHLKNEIPGADLDKARLDGKMTADLSKIGLAPSKQAYLQKMADLQSTGRLSPEKPQSRLSKLLFGDREKNRPPASGLQASLKPCVDKECKPIPSPCVGKNCRPLPPCQGVNCPLPPPAQPVVDTGCAYLLSGAPRGSSYCQPLGYIDHCDGNGTCYAHLGQVNDSYCNTILGQLKLEIKQAANLLKIQQAACSADPQGEQCSSATGDYQAAYTLLQQLAAQYQMCRTAAGLGPANINLPPSIVTAAPSGP